MSSPLIERLLNEKEYPLITAADHDAFVADPGVAVLFFAGDPKQYKETNDVAVVLPELVAAFQGQLRPAVVDRSAELELQRRYGFKSWPSLVFVRAGGWLGTISGIQNWGDYLGEVQTLLQAEPTRPPGFKIPVVPG
jgi:hydrogenase-1 operon protein HyaE